MKEPAINNKESLINDTLNEQSTKIINNLEEPKINSNILNEPTITNKKSSINNNETTNNNLEERKINNNE